MISTAAGLAVLALSVPGLVLAGYLLILALAAVRRSRPTTLAAPWRRVAVLVPAHDEAVLVARCVRSLLEQQWPAERRRVIVIADNCGDGTAETAAGAGAEVWVRRDEANRGKGHALRWAIDHLLAEPRPPDAVVVVDADSVADPGLLLGLDSALGSSGVAQADYLVLDGGRSPRTRLVALAFRLFHRVRLGGRASLGLPAALVGNGMAFSREVLEAHPWDAFTGVEDLELTLRLRLAGVKPRFAAAAQVFGPVASEAADSVRQRERWEGGRFHAMRTWLPRLAVAAAGGRLDLLDVLLDLAVPPLSLLGGLLVAGAACATALVAAGAIPPWAAAGWVAAACGLAAYLVVGLVAAGATARDWLALLAVPGLVAVKATAYARILTGFDPARWERTGREPQASATAIGGVRIDSVTMDEARARLRRALGTRSVHQVATVNMDFLATAQVNAEVKSALNGAALNIADGSPVVWLGRLRGLPVPGRVAGADLVPLLMSDARDAAVSVFLLGGENGSAAAAARELIRRYPGLEVAGVLEPPRAALDAIDSDAIVEAVNASGADILLVAFGHPKQDLWIARNRHRLRVSVAVGVGCVFDLLAGRVERAPAWMRRAGLEWLHRLVTEPGRLGGRYLNDCRWLVILGARDVCERMVFRPLGLA